MNILLSTTISNVSRSTKHSHPFWELVYRLSGNSNTTIGNITHHISEGDLYLVPPDVFHEDSAQDIFSDLVMNAPHYYNI